MLTDRLYFKQLLSGEDFAKGDMIATQMRNFAYLIGDRETGDAVVVDPAYAAGELVDTLETDGMRLSGVLVTHHHPDHFLGNQAFPADTLAALPETIHGIATEGGSLNENMYRLAGDWMAGTEPVAPARQLAPGPLTMGNHRLDLIALDGHTEADLVIFDRSTGVLFAGDLVFNGRTPTTPHAN